MLVTPNSVDPVAKIKVIGVGGGGNNTVDTMIQDYNIEGVEFYAFNTDAQALKKSLAPVTMQMGADLTRGLGVGGNHNIGAKAAEESLDDIHEHLAGSDMVFITAGMGGGTGTGAAPVISGVSKNLGALTVAVVTTPFKFEGRHRMKIAEEGLEILKEKVDTLIVVPNQRLLEIIDDGISFNEAMKQVDQVLAEGVQSISNLVTNTGFINVDFADVKTIMSDAGTSLMGMGRATGDNRAESAARQATNSPILNMSIEGATGVLFNIMGGENLSMTEINTAAELVAEAVDDDARIIFGASIDPDLNDELVITIVATGFDETKQVHTHPEKAHAPQSSNTVQNNSNPTQNFLRDDSQNSQPVQSQNQQIQSTNQSNESNDNSQNNNFSVSNSKENRSTGDDDELDVPAFMRRD